MTGDYQNELGELTIPGTLAKLKNYFALVGKYVLILGSSPHPLFRHSQRDAGDEKDTGKSYHGIAEYDSVTGQINGQLKWKVWHLNERHFKYGLGLTLAFDANSEESSAY